MSDAPNQILPGSNAHLAMMITNSGVSVQNHGPLLVLLRQVWETAYACATVENPARKELADARMRVQDLEEAQFQVRVGPWLLQCFGATIAGDIGERNHRFLEDALELVQSLGCTASEAHQLVDYVFARPVGEPPQELGGVMVTLAALARANGLQMFQAGEEELRRCWKRTDQIRAKQAAKPKHSPLPEEQSFPLVSDATDILIKVQEAVRQAAQNGLCIEVWLRNEEPLAMGNYTHAIRVRPGRPKDQV